MARSVTEDVDFAGWNIESVYGTDPGGVRLEIGGDVQRLKTPRVDEGIKKYRAMGDAYNTKRFLRQQRKVDFDYEWYVKRELNTACMLAMALGDAPAGDGTITLRPKAGTNNLRSFTLECGLKAPNARYWRARGCMVRDYELQGTGNILAGKAGIVAQNRDKQATAFGTLPTSAPALAVFDPVAHATHAVTGPSGAITGLDIVEWNLKIANELKLKGGQTGTADRVIGEPQLVDRSIQWKTKLWITGHDFEDILTDNDPSGSASEIDWVLTLSKNSGAEFVKMTLTDCRIMSVHELEFKADPDVIGYDMTLEPESYAFDVITP